MLKHAGQRGSSVARQKLIWSSAWLSSRHETLDRNAHVGSCWVRHVYGMADGMGDCDVSFGFALRGGPTSPSWSAWQDPEARIGTLSASEKRVCWPWDSAQVRRKQASCREILSGLGSELVPRCSKLQGLQPSNCQAPRVSMRGHWFELQRTGAIWDFSQFCPAYDPVSVAWQHGTIGTQAKQEALQHDMATCEIKLERACLSKKIRPG